MVGIARQGAIFGVCDLLSRPNLIGSLHTYLPVIALTAGHTHCETWVCKPGYISLSNISSRFAQSLALLFRVSWTEANSMHRFGPAFPLRRKGCLCCPSYGGKLPIRRVHDAPFLDSLTNINSHTSLHNAQVGRRGVGGGQ